ncbi:MAG TPA: hypothetical protein VMP03_14550, partial [Methylomirabilota bacterium]|nr:hypothetical protein [Methylomirabilota bacterium]
MSALPQPETWLLVAVDADGRTGQPLARIASIEAVGAAASRNGDLAPPLFVRTELAGASEAALSAALRAGASGVLLLGGGGWDDVERLAVRIDVAEAVAGRPAGS